MKQKIFIEFDNSKLYDLSIKLYNLFLENNYDVTLLDNNITLNEKLQIINTSQDALIISNKINNDNNNAIEIIYPLRNTDQLAKLLSDNLMKLTTVTKYYQLRSTSNTALDYYEILRNNSNSNGIIFRYGTEILNNNTIPQVIYQTIVNFLNEQNIYTVKSGDSLYSIAKRFNTTVNLIKEINNLTTNNLSIEQKLIIPNNNENNTSSEQNIYTVKSGDSLYSIAKRFNTTVDLIKEINNLTTNNLSIEQKLIIPNNNENNTSSKQNIYTVKSGDSLYSIAKRFNTTVNLIKEKNNLTTNNLSINQKLIIPNNTSSEQNIYTVKSGDSLYSIAKRFNTTVDLIKEKNNLTNNNLSIEQKLIIS